MGGAPRVLMVTGEYPPIAPCDDEMVELRRRRALEREGGGLSTGGGVGDYTALISRHLEKQGTRVVVLTDAIAGMAVKEPGHPEVLRGAPLRSHRMWAWVASAARANGCRIVHLQYQAAAYGMTPAVQLLPAYLRALQPELKVVTTFHDLRVPYLFPRAGPLRRASVRALDLFSHRSVATNRADLQTLGGPGGSEGAPRRWLIPIGSNVEKEPPAGFDRAERRRELGAADDTLLLSYFGFMNDSKGVEFLVQALEMLAARGVDARLVIVGGEAGETDPTNKRYAVLVQEMIRSRGLEKRVIWTGFLPPWEVSASLLASDICALPFRDGASLSRGSLLAALAHGLPVVTARPEGPEPLLREMENVMMVDRDSPVELARAIEDLWCNPESRIQIAAGALRLAAHFQWPDIAAHHIEMYKNLLGSRM